MGERRMAWMSSTLLSILYRRVQGLSSFPSLSRLGRRRRRAGWLFVDRAGQMSWRADVAPLP